MTDGRNAKMDRDLAEAGIRLDILLDTVRAHNAAESPEGLKCPPGCIGGEALCELSHYSCEGTTLMLIAALDRLARS